jgi:probable addiction module antidote protein
VIGKWTETAVLDFVRRGAQVIVLASALAAALGDIARARGMTEIARSAGITREALYKALRPESAPRFDMVRRVCAALGVRLVVQPAHP